METLHRAAAGDADAFRDLVARYRRFVYALCLAGSRNPSDAEDLTQEVFLSIHRDLPSLREPGKFLPWLRQVAKNACRLWYRRHEPATAPLDEALGVEDLAAGGAARRAEVRRIIVDTLAAVSERSREVLALHYLGGCSEAEIAEALGLRRTTVKSRLHEGRAQARRALEPLVRELLLLDTRSGEAVEEIVQRCGSPGCGCPETLTEGR
ncbi:MAG: sigma-70 family RNA polymerase sigma factor [Thermodesulfobacteriota bacterium]